MNKLVLICLLLVIPTAFSAAAAPDCANPLLALFGFTALSAPTAQTGLSLCKHLEGDKLCCSTATINSIQDPINSLVTDLIQKAALRDKWLLSIRADTTTGLPSFKDDLATLQTSANSAKTIVAKARADAITADAQASTTNYDALLTAIAPWTTWSDDATTNVDTNWASYESTRATCMNALIEAQASILCLACTSDYNANGVDTLATADPLINLDISFNAPISAACAPFVTQAQKQNVLTTVYTYRKVLATLSTSLGKITAANAGTTSVATLETGFTPEAITEDYEEPLDIIAAAACTTSDCGFAYDTLWTKGATLNDDYAANGGEITVSDSRLLGESRTLAGFGSYDPSDSDYAAGITVDFPEDAIAAASAFRQGGLMTCLVALIAVFLF